MSNMHHNLKIIQLSRGYSLLLEYTTPARDDPTYMVHKKDPPHDQTHHIPLHIHPLPHVMDTTIGPMLVDSCPLTLHWSRGVGMRVEVRERYRMRHHERYPRSWWGLSTLAHLSTQGSADLGLINIGCSVLTSIQLTCCMAHSLTAIPHCGLWDPLYDSWAPRAFMQDQCIVPPRPRWISLTFRQDQIYLDVTLYPLYMHFRPLEPCQSSLPSLTLLLPLFLWPYCFCLSWATCKPHCQLICNRHIYHICMSRILADPWSPSFWRQALECGGKPDNGDSKEDKVPLVDNKGATSRNCIKTPFGSLKCILLSWLYAHI